MIRLPDHELDGSTAAALDECQAEVDRPRSYRERVELAKERWEQVHRSARFNPVKSALARMCCGARRCAYCEDSYADEVEHFRPKDLYPEHVFRWPNYAYTCGPCNGPKGNQFAVFTSSRGGPTLVARGQNDPVTPPAKGPIALIDPRSEDPLEYLWLDLEEFVFTENADEGTRAWHRAHYTIDTLGLNRRDELVTARASAYGSFRARLKEYRASKAARVAARQLHALRDDIRSLHHQTVLAEMQRQRTTSSELKELFKGIPEAVTWKPQLWNPAGRTT